jgi:hypothetical protein
MSLPSTQHSRRRRNRHRQSSSDDDVVEGCEVRRCSVFPRTVERRQGERVAPIIWYPSTLYIGDGLGHGVMRAGPGLVSAFLLHRQNGNHLLKNYPSHHAFHIAQGLRQKVMLTLHSASPPTRGPCANNCRSVALTSLRDDNTAAAILNLLSSGGDLDHGTLVGLIGRHPSQPQVQLLVPEGCVDFFQTCIALTALLHGGFRRES